MRLFAILLLCVSVSAQSKSPVVDNPPEQNKAQQRPHKESAAAKDPGAFGSTNTEIHKDAAAEKPASADHATQTDAYRVKVVSNPGPDAWYICYVLLTAIATAVNIGLLIAVYLQGRHTKVAADAALLNAKAIINAERPWIIPKINREILDVATGEQDSAGQMRTRRQTYFTFEIVNKGRTPAHILTVTMTSEYTNSGDELPAIPDYGLRTEFIQQRILEPDAPPMNWIDEWTWFPEGVLVDGLLQEVKYERSKRWWRVGHVIYKNVLDGAEHETRFCYLYSVALDDFIIAGPAAYTNYT